MFVRVVYFSFMITRFSLLLDFQQEVKLGGSRCRLSWV